MPSIAVLSFPELPEHGDVTDFVESGGTAKLLLARIDEAFKRAKTQDEMIEPVDLWGQFDPPALPTGLLPTVIEKFAFEEAKLMGADPCGLAASALAVCAAALPDHTKLQVKRYDPNWLEEARLWIGLIGKGSQSRRHQLEGINRDTEEGSEHRRRYDTRRRTSPRFPAAGNADPLPADSGRRRARHAPQALRRITANRRCAG